MTEVPLVSQAFDVSTFQNYRELLSTWLAWKQKSRGGFSMRLLAKRAGIQSPTFLSDVLAGKKNLSLDSAKSLSQAMSLNPNEEKYFISLVRLNQSKNESEQSDALRSLQAALVDLREEVAGDDITHQMLSTWYFIIVALLSRIPGAKREANWLVEAMQGLISIDEADTCLKALTELEQSTGKTGADIFDSTRKVIFRKKSEVGVAQSTLDMFEAWQKLLVKMPTSERLMNTLMLPISQKGLERLQKRIHEFTQEASGISMEDKAHDRVVWFALYLIPATIAIKA